MGYRSCVAYMVVFDTTEARTKFLARVDTTLILPDLDLGVNPTWVCFREDWTKWYDDDPEGYPDVAQHMALMAAARKDSGASGGFIRVGEGWDGGGDVEDDFWGNDDTPSEMMRVTTDLVVGW